MTLFSHIHNLLKKIFVIFEDYNETRIKVLYSKESFWQEKVRLLKNNDIYYFFSYKDSFVREAILSIKSEKNIYLANTLGSMAGEIFTEELSELIQTKGFSDPIVTFVPIFKTKEKIKGFNHSKLIAESFAKKLNLNLEEILIKTKDTPYQHLLQKEDRIKNIKNTFALHKGVSVQNKCIIVIDDVSTTGMTLQEIDNTLWNFGAKKIIKVALCH